MKSRIELIKGYISEDTSDPFNYYALALEYQKTHSKEADDLFENLLIQFENYLPTYYTAAKHFENVSIEKAITIYEKGIKIAQNQNNTKAFNELKTALTNLMFED